MPRNNPDHYKLAGSRKEDPQRAARSRARLGAQEARFRRKATLLQPQPPTPPPSEPPSEDSETDR